MAQAERLEGLSHFELIASIVERYPVYTFNQVFEMENDFINKLMLVNLERLAYNERYNQAERMLNTPAPKTNTNDS